MAREARSLTVTSLLSALFGTFHVAEDIVRGFEPGGVTNVTFILITVVWLYGAVVLAERRSGYIIMLLGSLLGSGVPVIHMTGAGMVGGRIVALWDDVLLVVEGARPQGAGAGDVRRCLGADSGRQAHDHALRRLEQAALRQLPHQA
jgi:hypothetical protein